MNAKSVIVGIVVVGIAGAWWGRAAWRTHHKLVTLHVRNAPLTEVARSIERQTKEKVRVDQTLDSKITLDVRNKPLNEVLDQLADQAGARWGKTYAVYTSENALHRLESVLNRMTDLETAGWTNLAPHFEREDPHSITQLPGGQIVVNGPEGGAGGGSVRNIETEDVFRDALQAKEGTTTNQDGSVTTISKGPGGGMVKMVRKGPGGGPPPDMNVDGGPHKMRQVMVRKGPGGTTTTTTDSDGQVRTVRTAADGKVLKEDQWSADRLVLDNVLSSRLREPMPTKANPESAALTATTVGGKVATYYALEKPPIAVDPGMKGLVSAARQRSVRLGTNGTDIQAEIANRLDQAKQVRLEEMSKSPEQQVQRARQKQAAQSPNN